MDLPPISEHLYRVFHFASTKKVWLTVAEIAVGARVAPRTARAHCDRLVRAGVFEQANVFPAHRFRLAPNKKGQEMLRRLEATGRILDHA